MYKSIYTDFKKIGDDIINILLVDDEIAIINIIKEKINWDKLGIDNVYIENNVQSAKKTIKQEKVNIIICDIEMPKESGLELIEWVHNRYTEILNVILTGFPDFKYAKKAISLGTYEFLLKPIDFGELEKVIKQCIEKIKENNIMKTKREFGEILFMESSSEENNKDIIGNMLNKIDFETINETKNNKPINIVKKYIKDHYAETITRKDIEDLVHLNTDYLNREFKDQVGHSLMEYIQYYRILMAKKILITTDISISEVCVKIGYNSPSYFSKLFKKWTHITPMEYREKHLSENNKK